jgi:hypothetical protein
MLLRDPRRAPAAPERDHSLDVWPKGDAQPTCPSFPDAAILGSSADPAVFWVVVAALAWFGYRGLRAFAYRLRPRG